MEKVSQFSNRLALSLVGLLVIFAGIGSIFAVVGSLEWSTLGDWLIKAVIIAIIILLVGFVSSLVVTNLSKKED